MSACYRMEKPLFALRSDLDMITKDVQNLKMGYGTLDYIVNEIHHLRLEQDCQGAQMRRIDSRLDNMEKGFNSMEKQLRKISAHLKIK